MSHPYRKFEPSVVRYAYPLAKVSFVSAMVFSLVACASRPDSIAPATVSANEYQGLSCSELTRHLGEKRESLREAERQQNRAATGDAVGVFLVLLPVSTIFGSDNEGVVAQYKGEVLALERAMGMECRG